MDELTFDRFTLQMSRIISRRAAVVGLGALTWPSLVNAEKKKRKRKRKKRVKRNAFGCVDVGTFCKNSGQCCSGICKGKKGKKKCKAHDAGGCTGEQDVCAGVAVPCITAAGENGACVRTTGNAGYCEIGSSGCLGCTRDSDCQATCGSLAACVVCEIECGPNGTACVGPSETSCTLPE